MPRPKEDVIRYRFAVPTQDASVHEWLESQMNMSMSLRLLIKEDIVDYSIQYDLYQEIADYDNGIDY